MKLPLVLLVDDDEDDLLLLEWVFSRQQWPCQLLTFRDGESALLFLKNTIDIPTFILLDQQMPGLSGLEVLGAMRDLASFEYTLVIIMSGETPPTFTAQIRQTGGNGYFVKPTSVDQWQSALRQIIRSLPVPLTNIPSGKQSDL